MGILIKNGRIYAPHDIGVADILIIDDKIKLIDKKINIQGCPIDVEEIDASGKIIVPGFIDQHVHLIGGGGEGGFHTRTPEVMLSDIIKGGLTTIVGLLGTDGTTRQVEALYAKAKALEFEGITTYILTGSYEVPTVTITGQIKKDIMFIDNILGLKVALSDHRSSHVTEEELTRIASVVRVSSMLSGKPGVICLHMGDEGQMLDIILNITKNTHIPIKHFIPTHTNRNKEFFEEAKRFLNIGGCIDITAYDKVLVGGNNINAAEGYRECLESGLCKDRITMSSDGNGSMPVYDKSGSLIGMEVGSLKSLHFNFCRMVAELNINIEDALLPITKNPAMLLGLYPKKGCIKEESNADILILNADITIDTVIAKGQILMSEGSVLVRGTFEKKVEE